MNVRLKYSLLTIIFSILTALALLSLDSVSFSGIPLLIFAALVPILGCVTLGMLSAAITGRPAMIAQVLFFNLLPF